MTDGDFPFRSFTVRAEGYDRGEVDAYVAQLQGEISELRRAAEVGRRDSAADARLHDPEGAVTRTLAIAQETADRVLHDAQVEADRRRAEADEQATNTIADADARAAKMMADIETQTAEVRAQGIAAARTAIQVERDKAVAELGQIRRVRDDIRAEAVELKALLDRYARQSSEAAEALGAAASGPLMTFDLPEFVSADVALAGMVDDEEIGGAEVPSLTGVDDGPPAAALTATEAAVPEDTDEGDELDAWILDDDDETQDAPEPLGTSDTLVWGDDVADAPVLEAADDDDEWFSSDLGEEEPLAEVIAIDGDAAEDLPSDLDDTDDGSSGAFLAEVRAAADDEGVAIQPEGEAPDDSDRFLSELRGVTGSGDSDDGDVDDEAADRFFDVD